MAAVISKIEGFLMRSRAVLSIFLGFFLVSAHADDQVIWPRVESVVPKDSVMEARIDEILQSLSIKEKVGQMIQAEIKSISPEQVRKYNIGSVLSGGGSWPAGKGDSSCPTCLSQSTCRASN